nr:hypothetical protein [Tanacetum cinerariifolium]
MGYEHLSTIPETKSDEVTESGVKKLVPIPSECEVTSVNKSECDLPVYEDHSEILSDSNNDDSSSDEDAFGDIEYVEATPLDSELVSLEEENDGRLTSVIMKDIYDDSSNDPLLEEVDLFLASDNSIPSGTAAVPKPYVTRPRQAKTVVTKPPSLPGRNINCSPSPKASTFPPKVTAAKAPMINGNPQHALKDKKVIDRGCSRYMTGNMSYLSDFEELNGGYVAFGGNPKGGKISGKEEVEGLIRVPVCSCACARVLLSSGRDGERRWTGDVVIWESYKPKTRGKLYYACTRSKPLEDTFGCKVFLWKKERVRLLVGSLGASTTPIYSPGSSSTLIYSPRSLSTLIYSLGSSTPPRYSPGASTPQSYSLGTLRNAECSNYKHLLDKITVIEATVDMYMYPEQHTVNSAALFHEVYTNMGKLDLE